MQRIFIFSIVISMCVALGGCFAPPVMLAGAGLSAAQEGATAYVRGKLSTALAAPLPEVYQAALDAVTDHQYEVRVQEQDEDSGYIIIRDMTKKLTTVEMLRVTPRVTKVRIRVGFWGDPAIARLLIEAISTRVMRMDLYGPDEREW